MSQLSPLMKTALLGTRRELIPELMAGTPLAHLLAKLTGAEPEATLLSLAGAAHLGEMAGQLPLPADDFAPSPAHDLPLCGTAARRRLNAMLDGRFSTLLPEFLAALVLAGQCVPDELLPSLLQVGVKSSIMRPLIIQVIGQAGRWLASQNPGWAYASPAIENWDALATLWRELGFEQRALLLVQLRAMHADWALALLQITWKSESASAKSAYLRKLEYGLSAADESFLETALDDRDLPVRRVAAEMLAKLAGSRLVQRMTGYADDILRWTPFSTRPITVTFPKPIPAPMIRDGINAGDTPTVRRVQLGLLLGAVPLAHWEAAWKTSPEKIMQAALASGWPRALIRGFALAAVHQRNVRWARAILTGDLFSPDSLKVTSVLSLPILEQLILDEAQPDSELDTCLTTQLLHQWNSAWSIPIAQRWVAMLARHICEANEQRPPGTVLRIVVKRFGQFAPVEFADEAESVLMPIIERGTLWGSMVHEALILLRFRQSMLAEIQH